MLFAPAELGISAGPEDLPELHPAGWTEATIAIKAIVCVFPRWV